MIKRRTLFIGLLAAPVIVQASSLMRLSVLKPDPLPISPGFPDGIKVERVNQRLCITALRFGEIGVLIPLRNPIPIPCYPADTLTTVPKIVIPLSDGLLDYVCGRNGDVVITEANIGMSEAGKAGLISLSRHLRASA
jgi:hypothetical protein